MKSYPCNILRFFSAVKIENYIVKFLIFLFNMYPQSMFWTKNTKICVPLYTPVLLYKSGV